MKWLNFQSIKNELDKILLLKENIFLSDLKNISNADKQKMFDTLALAGIDTSNIDTTEELINAYGRHISKNTFNV